MLREDDLAIRYGGDEFLLVFPGSTATMAAKAAERIVRLFGQQARLLPVQPQPSMSAGVAALERGSSVHGIGTSPRWPTRRIHGEAAREVTSVRAPD